MAPNNPQSIGSTSWNASESARNGERIREVASIRFGAYISYLAFWSGRAHTSRQGEQMLWSNAPGKVERRMSRVANHGRPPPAGRVCGRKE